MSTQTDVNPIKEHVMNGARYALLEQKARIEGAFPDGSFLPLYGRIETIRHRYSTETDPRISASFDLGRMLATQRDWYKAAEVVIAAQKATRNMTSIGK